MMMLPYIPENLPIDLSKLNWREVTAKVSEASAALAYYNGILKSIINPAIFLSPLETKEAVLSSRIEGTITTVDEVLRYEVDIKPDNVRKQDDIIEVLNYRKAMRSASQWLGRGLPFNITMICAIQKELMQGTRGKDKHPGEIRKEQVWIGPRNRPIEDATYIPPEPLGLRENLENYVSYLNNKDQEALIQTAIMHAQLEVIHPFSDGNGRTGRILIPLFLWFRQRISSPMFYISEYFDKNRDEYIQNLGKITGEKDWGTWISFFLTAVMVQAEANSAKATQVLKLYNSMREKMVRITKSPYSIKILDALFTMPILRPFDLSKISGLETKSVRRIIAKLKDEKVLRTIQEHAGRTPEVLVFNDLYQIIR
jgi:Fic family protein